MILKTAAIILGSVKYGDNSVILKAYTKEHGVMSFIAGSLHSKKGPLRPSMIQPLAMLQLVYYQKSKGELKRIKEAGWIQHYDELFFDPVKNTLIMFLAEFFSHVLKEEEANPKLFQFLQESLVELDSESGSIANFHLKLMYRLTGFLGFTPEVPHDKPLFDLLNGVYIGEEPPHFHFLKEDETSLWKHLHQHCIDENHDFRIGSQQRSFLLESLLRYYRLHVHDFSKLRSLEVVRELLS